MMQDRSVRDVSAHPRTASIPHMTTEKQWLSQNNLYD